MNNAVYPLESPAALSHPRLGEFCARLPCQQEPFLVPLAHEPMPIENCYWNVLAQIQSNGGEILFGWMLNHWPGLYLAAEHHAVWRRTDGRVLDVTDRPAELDRPHGVGRSTTFVLDSNQDFDLNAAPNIHIEFLRLSDDSRVIDLIDLSADSNAAAQSVNEFLVNELRLSSHQQMAMARGESLDRVQITSNQLTVYERMIRRCSEIRLQIGDLIVSLISYPPNCISHHATREHANQR